MRITVILASVWLTACATTPQPIIDRQNTRYDQCVDRIHEQAAKRPVNWSLEIDACMGRKGEEYDRYQAAKDSKLPPRWAVQGSK
jgi:hypothetical protein